MDEHIVVEQVGDATWNWSLVDSSGAQQPPSEDMASEAEAIGAAYMAHRKLRIEVRSRS